MVCSILDDSDLVAVASEEASELEIIHGTGDSTLSNLTSGKVQPLTHLVAVGVQDGNDSSTLFRVEILLSAWP